MSEFYEAVFDEFKTELGKHMEEIFLHPLPFTQINRLAMLAATVAERMFAQQAAPDQSSLDRVGG